MAYKLTILYEFDFFKYFDPIIKLMVVVETELRPSVDLAIRVEPKLRTPSEVKGLIENVNTVRLRAADPSTNHVGFEERQQILAETLGKIDVLKQFASRRLQTEEQINERIAKTYKELERIDNELGKTWEQVQQEFEKAGYLGYIGPQDGVKSALNSRKTYLQSSLDAYNWLLGADLQAATSNTQKESQVAA